MRIACHITAYLDSSALACVLESIHTQDIQPDWVRVVDNSPVRLVLPSSTLVIKQDHQPTNIGTAGAINRSIYQSHRDGVDYLWILDQDSVPNPTLLSNLIKVHQSLSSTSIQPVGIIAPLTLNRDDGQPNVPMHFDRYRARAVPYGVEPVQCDFLPASGMLLHLPSLAAVVPPSDRYFLDGYDFALGLAVRAAGATVWLAPSLQLSHQVGSKVTFLHKGHAYSFADMPVFRVKLLHRNITFLFIRAARGRYKLAAAAWQFRRACLQAARYLNFPFDKRWSKVSATVLGFFLGLFCLPPPRTASHLP